MSLLDIGSVRIRRQRLSVRFPTGAAESGPSVSGHSPPSACYVRHAPLLAIRS